MLAMGNTNRIVGDSTGRIARYLQCPHAGSAG